MASPLGLSAAVQGGIDAGRQRKDDDYRDTLRARETSEFELENSARAAGAKALETRRQQWVDAQKAQGVSADPSQFKPGGADILGAYEAYANTYAQPGAFNPRKFAEAQVQMAPIRHRVRSEVIQRYNSDKNVEAFVRDFYNTVPDGDEVGKVEVLKGGPAGGQLGAPSGPDMVRVTTKKGRVWEQVPVDKLVESASKSLIDPVKWAEKELEVALAGAKAAAEAKGKSPYELAKVKAEQEGLLARDAAKAEGEKGLKAVEHGYKLKELDVQGLNSVRTANVGAGATVKAAEIRAGTEGDGGSSPKTLTQANRAVETARNALHQATQAAISIRLPNTSKNNRLTADERSALVANDPQVKAARDEHQRALDVRNKLATGGAGLSGAAGPGGKPPAPAVLKFDASGNLVK